MYEPVYEQHVKCVWEINECIDESHGCLNEATCLNTAGSYTCLCPTGYTGDMCQTGMTGQDNYLEPNSIQKC